MPRAALIDGVAQHGRMDTPDLARRLENLLMLGTVAAVDHAAARCRVQVGELLTTAVPWLVDRAGGARTWWAPSVGEQVLLLSPGGDPARAVVLPAIYCTAHPAPEGAADTAHVTTYDDGAVIAYDPAQHQLTATLPAGGKASLVAPAGVQITGDVDITGKLHVTDDVTVDTTLTATTDVIVAGIKLKTHTHTGVTAGTGVTGGPQ